MSGIYIIFVIFPPNEVSHLSFCCACMVFAVKFPYNPSPPILGGFCLFYPGNATCFVARKFRCGISEKALRDF